MVLILSLPANNQWIPAIVGGVSAIFAVWLTAWLAIRKYHSEQRTSRLQKLYFEDTLLGLVRGMEEIMAQSSKNVLLAESLFYLTKIFLTQKFAGLEITKKSLEASFNNALNNIEVKFNHTDFKKETIAKLLGNKECCLPIWIEKFEVDSHRFSSYLRCEVLKFKAFVDHLNETNLNDFQKALEDTLDKWAEQSFVLVKRHYVLLFLLSRLVLAFAFESYASVKKIRAAFKKREIRKIIELMNVAYKELITNFQEISIGPIIDEEDASKMGKKIRDVQKQIFQELAKFDETN